MDQDADEPSDERGVADGAFTNGRSIAATRLSQTFAEKIDLMTKADSKFLFVFGFEDPIDFEANRNSGSDFESSRALWIIADDSSEAECWGRSIADRFVHMLFEAEDSEGYSWSDAQFAHWIEAQPTGEWTAEQLAALPVVRAGEFPDFDALDAPCAPAQTNSEQGGAGQPATRSQSK